jgi:hypothetical protein
MVEDSIVPSDDGAVKPTAVTMPPVVDAYSLDPAARAASPPPILSAPTLQPLQYAIYGVPASNSACAETTLPHGAGNSLEGKDTNGASNVQPHLSAGASCLESPYWDADGQTGPTPINALAARNPKLNHRQFGTLRRKPTRDWS